MRRAAFVALLALLPAAFSEAARASPSSRLIYSRTPEASSCPDESELRKAVSKRFGYDPFFPWAKQTVVVQILRARTRYIARVQLLDEEGIAHGARELTSNQGGCSDIFEAAALAVSIALDAPAKPVPQEAPTEAQSTPSPPPAPEPTPAATVSAAPPPAPPLPAKERVTPAGSDSARMILDFGADALGSIGITPSVTPGLSAFVRGRLQIWSLAIEVRGDWPESKARSVNVGGGSVQAWLMAGSIAPCLHVGYFMVCAVGMLGALEASGHGIDPHNSESTLFAAAGARLGLEWPLSETLSLRARIDGVANLLPATLVLGSDEVWTPAPPFAGTLGLGVAARLP